MQRIYMQKYVQLILTYNSGIKWLGVGLILIFTLVVETVKEVQSLICLTMYNLSQSFAEGLNSQSSEWLAWASPEEHSVFNTDSNKVRR